MVHNVTEELDSASRLKFIESLDARDGELGSELSKLQVVLAERKNFKERIEAVAKIFGAEGVKDEFPYLTRALDLHRIQIVDRVQEVTRRLVRMDETPLPEGFVPRPKQIRVMSKMKEYFRGDVDFKRTGFLKYPTGMGKTVIMGMMLRTLAHHGTVNALVVSPRDTVNVQNEAKIRSLQRPDVSVKNVADIRPGENVDITISTTNLAALESAKAPEKRRLKPHYDVILVDECHRGFGEKMIMALRSCYPDAVVIGLSATPYMGTTKNENSLRSAFEYFEGEIDSITLAEACNDSDLCPIRAKRVLVKNENLKNCQTDEEMVGKLNYDERTKVAVAIARDKIPQGEKGIVFCEGVTHSKNTAKALQAAGIRAVHLDGASSDAEKEDAFMRLKLPPENPESIQFVCNSDLLIEGFDEDTLKHAIMLRTTFSLWMYEQMIGRICRLNGKDPSKIATIWDVLSQHSGQCTIHGLSRFYGNLKDKYLNGEIVFGPADMMGKTESDQDGEKTVKDPEEEIEEKGGNITIVGVVEVEDIAVVRVPRDLAYYQNPELVRTDLEAAAKVNGVKPAALTYLGAKNRDFTCANGEEDTLKEYVNKAKKAWNKATGETKSSEVILEELKELGGVYGEPEEGFRLSYFDEPEKLREALNAFASAYELTDPGQLKINNQLKDRSANVWGLQIGFKEFLRRGGLRLGLNKYGVLERSKRLAGFEYAEKKAIGPKYFTEEQVRADLLYYARVAGMEPKDLLKVPLDTVVCVGSGEHLDLRFYLYRLEGSRAFAGINGIYGRKVLQAIAPILDIPIEKPEEKVVKAPIPPPFLRPSMDDKERKEAEEKFYRDDENVRSILSTIANLASTDIEGLRILLRLPGGTKEIDWGNGLHSQVGQMLDTIARYRKIGTEGIATLHVLVNQLFPKAMEVPTKIVEMDLDYFEGNAKEDLDAYATALGLPSPKNININNPKHLEVRVRCRSGLELTLNEYVTAYTNLNKKTPIARLAWPVLMAFK